MVLISSTGVALFGWINSELGALTRLQESNAQAEAKINVMEFMHTVNPMLTPEGKASFSAYSLSWQAKEVSDVQDGLSYPRGISLYQLALYDTTVKIHRNDGVPWFKITLRQVGYKRVRDNKLPF